MSVIITHRKMGAITPEYVTKPELDIRLKGITDRQKATEEKTDSQIASMEKLIDGKLTVLQLMMEKNLAQYQALSSEMRAEINDLRGDVKAQVARTETLQSKLGLYISLLGVGISVLLVLSQMLVK